MVDRILTAWTETQDEQAHALANESDVLDVERFDSQRFVAHFHSVALACGSDGEVHEVDGYDVGYWFPEGYLRHVEPLRVITWIRPLDVFHPNLRFPVCCVGNISPGTPLVDLIYRTYEVVCGLNIMPDERDALNPFACQWARNHPERFPLDDRPLKRRSHDLQREALPLSPSQESKR